MSRTPWLLGSLVLALTAPLGAQQPDSATAEEVAPGVVHRRLVFNQGPWSVNILEVHLTQPGLSVIAARADDRFRGREKVSSIAARLGNDSLEVVGAINADFFSLATGENLNNQVMAGEIWKGVPLPGHGAPDRRTLRSQLAIGVDGRPQIDRFALRGTVLPAKGSPLVLDAVNAWPDSSSLVLYTSRIGLMTPPDSAGRRQTVIPLALLGRRGDTLVYRITAHSRTYGASLSAGGALAAGGGALARLAAAGDSGATVRVVLGFVPDHGPIRELVGGWPRLVVAGRNVADSTGGSEGTTPSFAVTRHPRTGVGFSRDSTTLYLITVDGRQESSSGMSLDEFAKLMILAGVSEGLNLDGGGSTTMVIHGDVVNRPSDPEGERTVGNALLVVRRRGAP